MTDASQPGSDRLELMSSFIMAGKAYASSLGKVEGGQVMLVLIALLIAALVVPAVAAYRRRERGVRR